MGHCFSLFVTPIILSTLTAATDYNSYSSSKEFTCASAEINDRCILHCDEEKMNGYIFDCGNSGSCIFECEQKQCLQSGILNAQNTTNLTVISSGQECLKRATVNLPNYGDASFYMTEQKSFKEMTVNSGTNTHQIVIDCTFGSGDECKELTVNAQTAQYLEIIIGANSELEGDEKNMEPAQINCPVNSIYTPSCVIDLSGGGLLQYSDINSIHGIPNDVFIKTGNVEMININITCIYGSDTNDGNGFVVDCACCDVGTSETRNPTPSILPTTNYPTNVPTTIPTTLSTITSQSITGDTNPSNVTSLESTYKSTLESTEYQTGFRFSTTNNHLNFDVPQSSDDVALIVSMTILSILLLLCCVILYFKIYKKNAEYNIQNMIKRMHEIIVTKENGNERNNNNNNDNINTNDMNNEDEGATQIEITSTQQVQNKKRDIPIPLDLENYPKAKVLWDYEADVKGDLSLIVGNIIYVLENDDKDGWWTGIIITNNTMKKGVFPSTYVEMINEDVANENNVTTTDGDIVYENSDQDEEMDDSLTNDDDEESNDDDEESNDDEEDSESL